MVRASNIMLASGQQRVCCRSVVSTALKTGPMSTAESHLYGIPWGRSTPRGLFPFPRGIRAIWTSANSASFSLSSESVNLWRLNSNCFVVASWKRLDGMCTETELDPLSIIDEGVSFDEGVYEAVGDDQKQNQLGVCFKDDDSISGEVGEDILEAETHFLQVNPPQRRHPSPYYYADLFREEDEEREKGEEEDEDKEGVGAEEAPIQDTQVPQREHHHHKHHHQHRHHHLHHHQHKHHHRHHHHHRHKHRIKEHRHSCEAEEGGEEGEEEPSDEVLPSHLLSDSPAAVGTSTVEVEGSASGGVVVAQGSGGSGGPEAGYGGGGPAPAFLAACLLRDWDLIFTTPASITGTAARSSTPSGTKGVARGLRACSCRGGRCVRGEEDEDGEVECCEVPLEEGEEEDMSGRQRHLYETAFDCKVRRSQDDLDEVDRVSNHPVLRMLPAALVRAAAAVSPRTSRSVQTKEVTSTPPKDRRKLTLTRSEPQPPVTREPKRPDERCADEKAEVERPADLPSFQTPPSLKGPVGSGHAPSPPPLRGYAPSPPSTAPLPTKFHNRGSHMNSLCSAPDLPAGRISSPARTKDSRLPVKSRRGRHGTDGPILEFKDRPAEEEMEEEDDERIEVREAVEGRSVVVVGRPSRAHCRPTLVPPSGGARPKYSSTESMATSSSAMSSLESLRSSTSEGNRSTSSSGSRRSSSLSSHSSDSGSARLLDLHRLHLHHHHHHHHGSSQTSQQLGGHQIGHPQLHILSPISDKSQEPASETSDNNRNNNSQGASPEERLSSPAAVDNLPSEPTPVPTLISDHPISPPRPEAPSSPQTLLAPTPWEGAPKLKRRVLVLQNKNLLNRALVQAAAAAAATSSSGEAEVQGSDSGISIESSSQGQCGIQVGSMGSGEGGVTMGHEDLRALPFDMPKLRRRLAADASGSSSTSVASNSRPEDLRALPFDMPKLRRRLRQQQSADGLELDGSSGVSQASSSQSVLELEINSRKNGKPLLLGQLPGATQPQASAVRPNLTLNLCGPTSGPSLPSSHSRKKRPGLSLELGCSALSAAGEPVDISVPLERQGWYHGAITRVEAESVLRLTKEGSYLVRNSESTRQDYSLSLKSARGFMHMRIQQNKENGRYILGQFSQPFSSIPEMIHFYTINRLPIKGAEHMCLLHPVIEQLL
ncbi:hypothetical protein J437_LFUL015365 [Ladona fulva]|uniref:SH2 domain-containing adapter protein D n=1 Tax=Ladona fulva TaxID=123851 RepID=A0A8K0P8F9_LADFU|nr:hypothetical protein J437_LFUL015365 [Ladona fulva]